MNGNIHGIDAIWHKRTVANSIAGSRDQPAALRRIDVSVCDRAYIFRNIDETEVVSAWLNLCQQC
jgi:hypothetical protein